MPSASSSQTTCQSSPGSDIHLPASQQVSCSYMKGPTQKQKRSRHRSRHRTRTRKSANKRKKMLPARVSRLLGSSNKPGLLQVGKDIFCLAGKSGRIGKLARGQGCATDVTRLCNIDANDRTFSTVGSRCGDRCGIELCTRSDTTNGHVGILLHATKAFLSSSVNNNESKAALASTRCIAIDCEMVGIGEKGSQSALARCSIVNYDGDVVYDKYVKPDSPVTDYRTPWSGIVEQHMINAIPFHQAQQEVSQLLKGKIVVGHDVSSDFRVLELKHPPEDVRDTSSYRGLRYVAGVDGKKRSVGLKAMTSRLIGSQIQKGPHCSVEDARATMSLYRLVDGHWEEDANSMYPERQFKSCFLDDHFWPDDI